MSPLLAALREQPVLSLAGGEPVIEQGERTGRLYVLIEGSVEVTKDGVTVTQVAEAGAVFGELAVLLDVPHTAAVRTVTDSRFYVIEDARGFLERHPSANWHLCRLLARRLDSVNKYLVDLKQQYAGHDHLGMVDGMLDLLMHRQPRDRVPPSSRTLRDPEVAD
ncbi:MAG: Crp/Fnr family transcriptional regulator [Verrucomicrobiales bacterium]